MGLGALEHALPNDTGPNTDELAEDLADLRGRDEVAGGAENRLACDSIRSLASQRQSDM